MQDGRADGDPSGDEAPVGGIREAQGTGEGGFREAQAAADASSATDNNIAGTWTVTTDGAQYMTLHLNLRQNGNDLQGSISDPWGSGTIPIRGSVSGNYVTFSTQSQYGGESAQLQFSGAIQRDSISRAERPNRRGDRREGGGAAA